MFTAEQALQLTPDERIAFLNDVNSFGVDYAAACEEFRKEGIPAKKISAGYPARNWQQVSELLGFFGSHRLVFSYEFTPPVPIGDGMYSITGYIYGLRGIARILVYSGAHILMPVQTNSSGKAIFNDKAIGSAMRYLWKNHFLLGTGISDGEPDIDDTPSVEINHSELPLDESKIKILKFKLVGLMIKAGYKDAEAVTEAIKAYKLPNGYLVTQSRFDELRLRLIKDIAD